MSKNFIFYLLAVTFLAFGFQSCNNDDDDFKVYPVSVQLNYPEGYTPSENVTVTLTNTSSNTSYTDSTDTNGLATFNVTPGVYQATTTERRSVSGVTYNFNGLKNFSVNTSENTSPISLDLTVSKAAEIIIKELYIGGCTQDSSTVFSNDCFLILYNNSDNIASLNNICLAIINPYNASYTNYDYDGETLSYANEGWIPAASGFWFLPNEVKLQPGEQITIALRNAIDNTTTYENSINFANSDYYCAYDIEEFGNTRYYPIPSSVIPTSHYLSAINFGAGNAWTLSNTSPALFLFSPKDITISEFVDDASYTNYYRNSTSLANLRKKVPTDWIIDGIEVFQQGATNYKRFTPSIDAGSVSLITKKGHTLYRNVDKEATEAIEGNSAKLVYNYDGGTSGEVDGTTDPSGIDAEASIANGARIIYKDTNSSTNDFHQRAKASLRD